MKLLRFACSNHPHTNTGTVARIEGRRELAAGDDEDDDDSDDTGP